MLINVTSTEQTIYMFISDGGASVIVGDRGIACPKRVGGGVGGGDMVSGNILQLLGFPKRYFMYFRHVFHRSGIFYHIDENIKRLQPPPQFLLSVERITKLILKKSVVYGGGGPAILL